jgi:hypothetical protein
VSSPTCSSSPRNRRRDLLVARLLGGASVRLQGTCVRHSHLPLRSAPWFSLVTDFEEKISSSSRMGCRVNGS